MKCYRGLYDEHGYHLRADDEPLSLHWHYVYHRKWHAELGGRQLALDLLIDLLGETIPARALAPQAGSDNEAGYAQITAAWLPRRHIARIWSHSPGILAMALGN